MTKYQTTDFSTSNKELIQVSRQGYLSVTRICDFCEHPYKTPDIEIKASALGQTNAMSRWMKNDPKSKADEKYAAKECQTTMWLLQGKGSTLIGTLCPKCYEFSSACTKKYFPKGEDQFLRDKFLTYVYFGMWWKIIYLLIFALFIIISIPSEATTGTFLFFSITGVCLHLKFKLFSRFDHLYTFIKNLQVIKFQAHITKEDAALILKDIYASSGMRGFRSSKIFDAVMHFHLETKQLGQRLKDEEI